MKTISYSMHREIPVIAEADVLVIGGGPGGMSASVLAARQGVKVVLAERYGSAGGMASFGEVTPFMPNHLAGATLDKPVFVEWCRKMWEYRNDSVKENPFDENIIPATRISKDLAMLAMEDLMLEAGVKLFYHHNLVDVIQEGDAIKAAVFSSKSGLSAICAKEYVDSTGDGDLAVLAGCDFEFGNEDGFCQPMTLCFKIGGVEVERMPDRTVINRLYDEAKAAGEIHCPRENVLWFSTLENDVIHFNTTRIIKKSGVNGVDLSDSEIEGRRQVREYLNFLRKHISGFEHAHIHSIAHHIGIRETRRILCHCYQTVDDFTSARKYADAIAKIRYPIDIHNPSGSGTIMKHLPENDWYEISYRSIVPKKCSNLLIGCRAISVDHGLHSSSRVMPPVCTVGQAAGMAAAMAVRQNCSPVELDGVAVRNALAAAGADL